MMKTKNWTQIIVLVGCILGGVVTGIIITAYHFGKTEGRAFPEFIFCATAGVLIANIIKYFVDKRRGINTTTSKLTLTVSLCVIVGLLIGAGIGYYFFKLELVHEGSYSGNSTKVSYRVGDCERVTKSKKLFAINYDGQNKILNAEVWVNCCGIKVKVERKDSTYKILEKQYGELCRCMCRRKVTIFNVPEGAKVEFLDKDGNSFILSPNVKFCGWSTYGKCSNDKDCIIDGCSTQVCRSKLENQIITTCEWIDCYDANKYGVECKCIDEKCQWAGK